MECLEVISSHDGRFMFCFVGADNENFRGRLNPPMLSRYPHSHPIPQQPYSCERVPRPHIGSYLPGPGTRSTPVAETSTRLARPTRSTIEGYLNYTNSRPVHYNHHYNHHNAPSNTAPPRSHHPHPPPTSPPPRSWTPYSTPRKHLQRFPRPCLKPLDPSNHSHPSPARK